MKNKILFILTILLASITGCENFLEENPKDFLSPGNIPTTIEDCDLMLNGAISYMHGQDLYDRQFLLLAGVSADDMSVKYTSGDRYEIDYYQYLNTNPSIESTWMDSYKIINECNIMIQKIPETSLSETVKEEYVAGAKFLRAQWYFNLVRLFGDNLILIQEPVSDFSTAFNMGTSPITDTYALIKEDIDYAAGNGYIDGHRLPVNDWIAPGRPTYGAAKALQSKIYMTMAGKPLEQTDYWVTARDAALEVKNMERYKLATNVRDIWLIKNENSPEFIYSVQNLLPDYGSMLSVQTRPDGWKIIVGDKNYWSKFFDSSDLRDSVYNILEWDGKSYTDFAGACPYIGKFKDINRENLSDYSKRSDSNFPIFRMSEIYLMFAECENEVNGPTQDALDALNAIRTRAGLSTLSGLSKEEFKENIIKERARELCYECKRRFDLQRWGMIDDVLSADPHSSLGWDTSKLYFPAPDRDALLNINLE